MPFSWTHIYVGKIDENGHRKMHSMVLLLGWGLRLDKRDICPKESAK